MDGTPSLLFVLLALVSGFCAGGWLGYKAQGPMRRTAPGGDEDQRRTTFRNRRLLAAGAALAVLGASLLLPVQSLVLTGACAGFAFVQLVPPRD